MTPYNFVNLAKIIGLDAVALTDHNTSLNCEAAIKVGEEVGLLVIPGMELTTSEDIHTVCLFPTLKKALNFSQYVDENRIHVKNKAEIYGRQVIMNENDEEIGEIEDLLLPASFIGMYDAYRKAHEFGGICYPAHIDRDSLSVLAVLGEIDPYCGFRTAELADITKLPELREKHPILNSMNIVTCSDAHYLENMRDAANTLDLDELTREAVIEYLDTQI